MAAYVIADVEVLDPEAYGVYQRAASEAAAHYGGRTVVRGVQTVSLDGNWQPKRVVIIEFCQGALRECRRRCLNIRSESLVNATVQVLVTAARIARRECGGGVDHPVVC